MVFADVAQELMVICQTSPFPPLDKYSHVITSSLVFGVTAVKRKVKLKHLVEALSSSSPLYHTLLSTSKSHEFRQTMITLSRRGLWFKQSICFRGTLNVLLKHEERNGGKLKVIMIEGLVPQWMVIAWVFVILSKFFVLDYQITTTC